MTSLSFLEVYDYFLNISAFFLSSKVRERV